MVQTMGQFRLGSHALAGVVLATLLRSYAMNTDTLGYHVHEVSNTSWGEMTITADNTPSVGAMIISRSTYALARQPIAIRVSGDPDPANNGRFSPNSSSPLPKSLNCYGRQPSLPVLVLCLLYASQF
ncbi:MAG: hypothetical protein Kow0080_35560 [Candidatus Promineifilaceae bacterium]